MTGRLVIGLVWRKVVPLSTVQLLSIVNDQAAKQGTQISHTLI
jgi:hypothetical protein